MSDNTTDLRSFTEEELRAELLRRQRESDSWKNIGSGWYFFRSSLFDEDGIEAFALVPIRWWHLHHSICASPPPIETPLGFDELTSSDFEYEGSFDEGARELIGAGFTQLDPAPSSTPTDGTTPGSDPRNAPEGALASRVRLSFQ